MPGRKSGVSTTSNGPEEIEETPNGKSSKTVDGLSDLSLPKSMIARLAKGVLPPNTQIHKDALLALHKSATVFVSYIASAANENAQASGKKTIAPWDVTAALTDVELEQFIPRLDAELRKYNEVQSDKRNNYRRKVKEEKAAAEAKDGAENDESQLEAQLTAPSVPDTNGHAGEEESAARPAKKLKRANGESLAADGEDTDMMEDVEDGAAAEEGDEDVDEDDEAESEDEEGDDEEEGEDEEESYEDPNSQLDPLGNELGHAGERDEALDEYDQSDSE